MKFVPVILIFIVPYIFYLVFFFLRNPVSRSVEQEKIRHSKSAGAWQMASGVILLLVATFILFPTTKPSLFTSAFQFMYALFASFSIANGFEHFRNPPEIGISPSLRYRGKETENSTRKAAASWKPRFSIAWICVMMLSLSFFFAIFSGDYLSFREAEGKQQMAFEQISKAGGTVDNYSIRIDAIDVTSQDLDLIGDANVRDVQLNSPGIDNEIVKEINKIEKLRFLNFNFAGIDDSGVTQLNARELVSLRLGGTKVTGETLPVENLKQLKMLHLKGCPITRDGLKRIGMFKSLSYLDLSNTPIDESMLTELAAIKAESLGLLDTNLSEENVERLEKSLPATKIFWTRPVRN